MFGKLMSFFAVVALALIFVPDLGAATRASSSCPNGNCPYNAVATKATFVMPAEQIQQTTTVAMLAPSPVDASHDLLLAFNRSRADRGLPTLNCSQQIVTTVAVLNDPAPRVVRSRQVVSTTSTARVQTSSYSSTSTNSAGNGLFGGRIRAWFSSLCNR